MSVELLTSTDLDGVSMDVDSTLVVDAKRLEEDVSAVMLLARRVIGSVCERNSR